MQITDNREAYKKRERKSRFEQPIPRFAYDTMGYYERVARGLCFQHELRVTREVKRRRALRAI
ncbi:MAG: hypothetical protein Tp118SUR00d2C21406351_55 [Prokaryotic dsDNA virus sp.]|nr:MAG: hypothetical protein Tp118SUR00d2C21406351_55 [Prokaryotic dsDNA virus sp.]